LYFTDTSTGKSYSESGNDRAAYARMANQIQTAIDQGHNVSPEARKILSDAEYIGIKVKKN